MQKISDALAYGILKKFGIPSARFELAKKVEEAKRAADKLGYPCVLKIDGEIIHKMKAGCVRIVNKPEDVGKAFEEITKNAKKQTKKIRGVIVQEYLVGDELIVGAKKDAQFGAAVMFGSGGILANVMKDVSFRVVPLERRDAEEMIAETKASAAYAEMGKGQHAVSDIILKIGRLMSKKKEIEELDINPLFLSKGKAVAGDVRIIVKK